jgi:type IV secretion system protein VirB9
MFKNMLNNKIRNLVGLLALTLIASRAFCDMPITTDNRIKTYVYNENEVYKVLIYNGYQCSVEFGDGETVSTISVGDTYSWKIAPVGRRLFIKPLENNVHTNMTVITNKRSYQFDVLSIEPDQNIESNLVYVLRFFYPE